MGSGFDEREKAMEAKWAHDEELRFRALSRRNKLLAQWAVESLALHGAAADAYAAALVQMEVRGSRDEDLVRKLHDDFSARSVAYSEHFIRHKMTELAVEATDQIMTETKA